jgi:small conductance mechanosensitive channel
MNGMLTKFYFGVVGLLAGVEEAVTGGEEAGTGSTTPITDVKTVEELLVSLYKYLAHNGMNLVYALIIFVIGRWVAKLISELVEKAMVKAKIDAILHKFVKNIVYLGLLAFVIVAALDRIGVDMKSFVVVIGAAGLAIGLALQGSLSNFAAGILLVIFRPFKVGDVVEISGKLGVVKQIQIFTTVLNSPDNIRIIVPNAQVTGGNILNYTINGTRRVDLVIGISYEDDIKKAKEVMEKVLTDDERVLSDPAHLVAVKELADSSVNFVVRPWVSAADYWNVYFDMTEKIKVALDSAGITIPFPQRDVHVKNGKSRGQALSA